MEIQKFRVYYRNIFEIVHVANHKLHEITLKKVRKEKRYHPNEKRLLCFLSQIYLEKHLRESFF